ncbi:YHS domain-containing protein [Thermodesulfobacteriota bacterium B35]
MTRQIRTLALLATCTAFLSAGATAALAGPQTTCPVMGGPVNKAIHADYQGQRVYFCCNACPPRFRQDPEKYLQKLKEMDQETEPLPAREKTQK